jgi:hypothetical protein
VTSLTRRPDRDPKSGGWFIYYGDVRIGHIGKRAGVPLHVDQWGWTCGFYPGCDPGEQVHGSSAGFEEAKAGFQETWDRMLPKKTEAHFEMWRRNRDFHAWKNRMHDEKKPMPTQRTDGRSQCFCGQRLPTPPSIATSTTPTAELAITDSQSDWPAISWTRSSGVAYGPVAVDHSEQPVYETEGAVRVMVLSDGSRCIPGLHPL